jgi:GNAT superfamily N-acetyltransferase
MNIQFGLKPGDAGEVVRWHGLIYHREYGFDQTFEAYVAGPLAEFIRRNGPREGIWIARQVDDFMGSIAIVEASADVAQLRWLLLRPEARGQRLGRRLSEKALDFCREQGYRRVILWTVDILPEAAGLYGSLGFVRTEAKPSARLWSRDLVEEKYELPLE